VWIGPARVDGTRGIGEEELEFRDYGHIDWLGLGEALGECA
jgi:hypothetical protein